MATPTQIKAETTFDMTKDSVGVRVRRKWGNGTGVVKTALAHSSTVAADSLLFSLMTNHRHLTLPFAMATMLLACHHAPAPATTAAPNDQALSGIAAQNIVLL